MSRRGRDPFGCLIVAGIAALVVGPFIGAYSCSRMACHDITEETGTPAKHDWLSGCYVKVNGKWVPEGRWRNVDE